MRFAIRYGGGLRWFLTAFGGNVWWAIGVHTDLRGSWLVNGATSGIVWLQLDPRPRAWCIGIPVRPRRLGLGLEEPEAFLAVLGAPPATA